MLLPLTVSCFSKIQIGFTFLVPAHPGSPAKRAVKRVCVCVCVCSGRERSAVAVVRSTVAAAVRALRAVGRGRRRPLQVQRARGALPCRPTRLRLVAGRPRSRRGGRGPRGSWRRRRDVRVPAQHGRRRLRPMQAVPPRSTVGARDHPRRAPVCR